MLSILYEDNHLLAISKPAGLATMGVAEEVPSLLSLARQYVKQRYDKPGNVYLGVVSRLDAPVTGVALFARTSKAAARLTEQFRNREVEKTYWAVVEGIAHPTVAECVDWMIHDDRHRRMHIAAQTAAGAQQARLRYRLVGSVSGLSLLEIALETGRKHQIRLQLSHRGYPIVGDRKYGSRRQFSPGIALHCRRLVVVHPVLKHRLELSDEPPPSWRGLVGKLLG